MAPIGSHWMNSCLVRSKSQSRWVWEYIRKVTVSHLGLSLLLFSFARVNNCSHIQYTCRAKKNWSIPVGMGPHFEKPKPGVLDINDTLVEREMEEGPLEFLKLCCILNWAYNNVSGSLYIACVNKSAAVGMPNVKSVTSPSVISQMVAEAEGMSESPPEIATPNLKSDLILWSTLRKSPYIVAPTVPWEAAAGEAYKCKSLKYAGMTGEGEQRGAPCRGWVFRVCSQVRNRLLQNMGGGLRTSFLQVTIRGC